MKYSGNSAEAEMSAMPATTGARLQPSRRVTLRSG